MGIWKMSEMKIESDEMQDAILHKQISMLQDSISGNTDSDMINKFQQQLMSLEKMVSDLKARQDSSMKKTRWEFKSNGDFIAEETDGKKNGTWSLDEDQMILTTTIKNQPASVHIKIDDDTLTLQFDSLNYMKFSKMK